MGLEKRMMHGGCQRGMARRRNDVPGSGCRHDCLHRADVEAYRDARAGDAERRKLEREQASNGYATEGVEYDADHAPAVTLKDWLIEKRRAREEAMLTSAETGVELFT